ncbi:hypothetical protein [Streptomyces lanatus]|uniref:Uncharacterized protein n=1 Tax=Streptomyces lanatus TaxID=66900 RepID=A0ABV1XLM8_9ACTN|nr:hypothetical protein [Streptomyces lanatus]GHG98818.1 hypothetical protein GCM10018780_24910 [Streptomyces lanatus]
MVYVELPEIGLQGEWSVSDAERTVAARLLPMLPAAPGPGADAPTRWQIVDATLCTVRDVIGDNGPLLFGGRTSGVPEEPGRVDMIGMPFAIGTLFAHVADTHRIISVNKGAAAANAYLAECVVRLEPEVAELRRLLAEAAVSDVGAYSCHEHQNGGPSLTFVEPDHGPEREVPSIDQLILGIRRLWPLVQPISAEAVIGCLDREFDYPVSGVGPQRPHWFIHDRLSVSESAALGEDPHRADDQALDVVDPWHVDPVIEAVPQLSAEVIRSWLERAQAQPSLEPETDRVGWTCLWFNATRALVSHPHVPGALWTSSASTSPADATPSIALEAAETRWIANVPCQWRDGAAWLAGPTREMRRHGVRAPITLYATNYGQVEVTIHANWSLWTEERSSGRAALIDVARTLLADGWRLDRAHEIFHELV